MRSLGKAQLIELKHLRYIVALAEELNFGRAAKRLFISQPPLSRQIQAVEEQLGFKLFERTKRQVVLTEGGKVMVEQARRILSESNEAIRLALMANQGETGSLRIGLLSTFDSIVPDSIRTFACGYPRVHIDVRSSGPTQLMASIQAGILDCAILRSPLLDQGLTAEKLYTEPLLAALAQDHPLTKRKQLSLGLLANETLLLLPRHLSPIYHDLIITLFSNVGFTPKLIRESESAHSLAILVAANQGIAIVGSTVQEFNRRDIALREIASAAAAVSLSVVYKRGNASKMLRRFLDILQNAAADRSHARRQKLRVR